MKTTYEPDLHDVETLISELESVIKNPNRLAALTHDLNYATDYALAKAIRELRILKRAYKDLAQENK